MVSGSSPIVCFLDESETDNNTAHAIVGGITLNRRDLPDFDKRWQEMLNRYGLPALHMIDLGPKGPYPHLIGEVCGAMLTEAVTIINDCRILTLAAPLNNLTHEAAFSEELRRKAFSAYFLAFLMTVAINHLVAEEHGYSQSTDFILDRGNKFATHIRVAKDAIKAEAAFRHFRIGDIEFATDADVLPLQAADIVSWSTRRLRAGLSFKEPHHSPLLRLFSGAFNSPEMPDKAIQELSDAFAGHAVLVDE